MPSHCFESCEQEQAIAEPIEGDGDMTFYWVRTKLGTIDRWSERDHWSDVEFVRPVEIEEVARSWARERGFFLQPLEFAQ